MIVWFDYGYNEHGHSLGGVGLQVPPFYSTKGMARHIQDKVWEHALAVKFKSENIQQALDATADCLVGAPCESSFCRFPTAVSYVFNNSFIFTPDQSTIAWRVPCRPFNKWKKMSVGL